MNIQKTFGISFAIHYLAIALMVSLPCSLAKAASYATGLTNSGGAITFILNEDATNVKIISNGGAATNDLGVRIKGSHTESIVIAGVFKVQVSSSLAGTYTETSNTNNVLTKFNSPRGVTVNQNPASPAFGRIYAANSAAGITSGRSVGDGIYMLNADQSDALGLGDTASTAGIDFTSGGAVDPWKIGFNSGDDRLYINNFSTAFATTWSTDRDVSAGSSNQVLETLGTSNPTVHTDSASTPVVRGSIAGNDLVLITVDGSAAGHFNQVARWDINSGPLPWNTAPTYLAYCDRSPNNLGTAALNTDVELGPDGKYYTSINRSAGTDTASVKVYDTDGTTLLWSSLAVGGSPDVLRLARAIAVSPDGKQLAVLHDNNNFNVIPLTNGVPDLPSRIAIATLPTTTIGRDIAFDAAGNIYFVSSGQALLRVYSVGGPRIATTGSDGTFNIVIPIPLVTVSAADSSAAEAVSPDTAAFTITRSGDTGSALTVNYAMSGTASNGIDYTTLSGSVTIPVGASSTNVTVTPSNDSTAEPVETVVITLVTNANYIVDNPKTATAFIADNETPALSIVALQPTVAETGTVAPFQVTRVGDTNVDLPTVNLGFAGSSATGGGVDYTAPASISIAPGEVTKTVSIDITTDTDIETNETIISTITTGSGYTVGSPSSATVSILDDDTPLPAGILFAANFDVDVAPLWTVNKANNTNGNLADFSFDYSTVGIPPAPNSGGTTKGLKMQANLTGETFGGLSVSPTGKNFSGDYVLTFDMWLDYHGPLQEGGNGTTQVGGAGVGTAGATAQWAGGTQDSVHFGATGDGASSVDYRAYSTAATVGYTPPSGVFAAGVSTAPDSRNNLDPYYAQFGGATAPAAQFALFPNQTGATTNGAVGMAWRTVTLTVTNNIANYNIDGLSIATVDLNTVTLSGGNILLNYYDINATSSTDTNRFALHFALFDNVKVSLIPIGITGINISGSTVTIDFTAAPSDSAGSFVLQSSTFVAGTYADDNTANFSNPSTGVFSVTTQVNGATQFYRIRRL